MKRYLIIAIVVLNCLMLIQAALLRAERAERKRMQSNNEVLTDSVEFYRTASGKHAASRQVLELRASEMERYNAQLAAGAADQSPSIGSGRHDGHADRGADYGAPGTRRPAAIVSVGEIRRRGAKGC